MGCSVYVKARHISYQRGKRNNNPNTSLVQIGTFYLGISVFAH